MTNAFSSRGLAVAVFDPTTLLGRDLRDILSARGFPASKVALFHTRGGDSLLAEDEGEAALFAPAGPDSLENVDVAFFCGKAEGTSRFLATRAPDGCLAIDLSGLRKGGAFARPDDSPGAPPLPDGNLFLTFEPAAAVLAEAVAIVDALVPVAALTAAVDRPASELGKEALDELFRQAIAVARFEAPPKERIGTQLAFNAHFPDDSREFESRVAEDVQRLVGRPLPVTILSVRCGVFHGHLLRLEIRTSGPAPDAGAIRAAFRKEAFFEETDPENLSGPLEAAGRDETLLLLADSSGMSVRLGLATDHLRHAGAVMAVRLAEQAVRERGLLADA
jgi:aspartate-semialdehyde dehydrogenase